MHTQAAAHVAAHSLTDTASAVQDLAEVRGRPPGAALLSHQGATAVSHVSIRVWHIPVLVAALSPGAFVLPAASSAVAQARYCPCCAAIIGPHAVAARLVTSQLVSCFCSRRLPATLTVLWPCDAIS